MADATDLLGCPISSILSLADRCSATAIPPCYLTATGADYGSDCCGSVYSWGTSVAECYLANAPDCLDTAAASDYVSDFGSYSGLEDPCAAYTTGLAAPTDTSGATAITGGGSSATATSTGASSTATGAAPKVGAGLKVYLAVALAGALAGLSL